MPKPPLMHGNNNPFPYHKKAFKVVYIKTLEPWSIVTIKKKGMKNTSSSQNQTL
jgi:hypothetical protein